MPTFSERNKTGTEHSGHGEASTKLRNRLAVVINDFVSISPYNNLWVYKAAFDRKLQLYFGDRATYSFYLSSGTFEQVFDTVEIFYKMAEKELTFQRHMQSFSELKMCFSRSGSVYKFSDQGEVILDISEDQSKNIEDTKIILDESAEVKEKFIRTISSLIVRHEEPRKIILELAIIFEEYCRFKTGENKYDDAYKKLMLQLGLHPLQKKVTDSLLSYRGDSDGVSHSTSSKEPDELDALWFLDTLMAQFKFLDKKLKETTI